MNIELNKETQRMCKAIARNYRAPSHYEDMVQEGLLVCLELLTEAPETSLMALRNAVNKRIYNYINFDVKGLSIPASDTARAIARGNVPNGHSSYSEEGIARIAQTLGYEWCSYNEDVLASDDLTSEELYLVKEEKAYLKSVAEKALSQEELEVIHLRYYQGMTQSMVSDYLKITKSSVQRIEKVALLTMQIFIETKSDEPNPEKGAYT